MTAAERRNEIMRVMYLRRFDKIENLAFEFGVSEKTIRRDIMILSVDEQKPIFTQQGRYRGGVYIMKDCKSDIPYMKVQDEEILRKAYDILSGNNPQDTEITSEFLLSMKQVIDKYSLPKDK